MLVLQMTERMLPERHPFHLRLLSREELRKCYVESARGALCLTHMTGTSTTPCRVSRVCAVCSLLVPSYKTRFTGLLGARS